MAKIIFIFLLIVSTNSLSAQYLHYWDDSHPRRVQPSQNPQPVENKKPEEIIAPPEITKAVKIGQVRLVNSVTVPLNKITDAPKIIRAPFIFHQWPDRCPGLSGSLPVINNYVPKEIVLIVTEKFKGHLYSISSYKGPDDKQEYKLKVCADGMIKYEYADVKGNIIAESEE